jgi:hypothetical protein
LLEGVAEGFELADFEGAACATAIDEGGLAEAIAGLAPGTQKALFIEHLMGDFPIRGGLGEMDFKRPTNRLVRAEWAVEIVNHKPNAVFLRSLV